MRGRRSRLGAPQLLLQEARRGLGAGAVAEAEPERRGAGEKGAEQERTKGAVGGSSSRPPAPGRSARDLPSHSRPVTTPGPRQVFPFQLFLRCSLLL